jgi:hypothetical protein
LVLTPLMSAPKSYDPGTLLLAMSAASTVWKTLGDALPTNARHVLHGTLVGAQARLEP